MSKLPVLRMVRLRLLLITQPVLLSFRNVLMTSILLILNIYSMTLRRRQLNITVMGTTEDVEDRKWNNGEVIDTKRKYTEEEKAFDVHYTLQQQR